MKGTSVGGVPNYYDLPIHKDNEDLSFIAPVMPVPECKKGLPYKFNTYEEVPEPQFDPLIHLALEKPHHVTLLPDYQEIPGSPPAGKLAYTQPFQILSAEGVKVMREIVLRNRPSGGPSRGSRVALRGLYYTSPWVRDLHNCPELLGAVSAYAGEQLVPTHHINAAPQVNFSVPGRKGAAEFWHWDSISYVANFLLNDPDEVEGGELEIIRMEKFAGMDALVGGRLPANAVEKMNYGPPGKAVLCQGSEILHHVTPVRSSVPRIVVILCFAPADVFKPDKLVLDTEINEDTATGHKTSAPYEFFRGRAWVCGQALSGMASKVPFTEDRQALAGRLRSVITELERVSSLLEGKSSDAIGFFDESRKRKGSEYLGAREDEEEKEVES